MCYEDVKIGLRRYAKYTGFAVSTTFAPNPKRVVFRVSAVLAIAGDSNVILRPDGFTGNIGTIVLQPGMPNGEITLEKHGAAVMGGFTVLTGTNTMVMEVIDNELDRAPEKGDPYNNL